MTPIEAYNKAFNSGERLPELESIIQQDDCWSYWYAKDVIGGRWPEAEPVIQHHIYYAYCYALEVIGSRWPEAEATISQDSYYAYRYAIDVIKDRWPEAEATIAQSDYKSKYIFHFFSEPVITKDQCSYFEWERAGAVGFFAPERLLEIKNSILDILLTIQ